MYSIELRLAKVKGGKYFCEQHKLPKEPYYMVLYKVFKNLDWPTNQQSCFLIAFDPKYSKYLFRIQLISPRKDYQTLSWHTPVCCMSVEVMHSVPECRWCVTARLKSANLPGFRVYQALKPWLNCALYCERGCSEVKKKNLAVNPFCSFLWLLPRYLDVAKL